MNKVNKKQLISWLQHKYDLRNPSLDASLRLADADPKQP